MCGCCVERQWMSITHEFFKLKYISCAQHAAEKHFIWGKCDTFFHCMCFADLYDECLNYPWKQAANFNCISTTILVILHFEVTEHL